MEKAIIIGYGKNGRGNHQALRLMGYELYIYDDTASVLETIEGMESVHAWSGERVPEGVSLVLKSPGVPLDHPIVTRLRDSGLEILTDIEFFYRNFNFPVVAITGTNGKTTTTTLVGEMFKAAGYKVCVAGNIGTGILPSAVQAEPGTWFVLELSSFQLESCVEFRPDFSTIVNLRPDHLSWHGGYDRYVKAKGKIWDRTLASDLIVINYDDEALPAMGQACQARSVGISIESQVDRGAYLQDEQLLYRTEAGVISIASLADIALRGRHNLQNIAAASALALEAGVPVEAVRQVATGFQGIAHRFEWLGIHGGRGFFNDSKGTNTEASAAAIQAVEGPKVLIGGGYDKGETFDAFFDHCRNHQVHAVVLMGETADLMRESAEKAGIEHIAHARNMEEAVQTAMSLSHGGDWILLSPACASWDQYKNYEERGEIFRQVVMQIEEGN